ncbi:MAG: DUF3810 family protein [Candidatus Hydrogenedens sp.]|nr:DUF3810 family protein [Candidatus Hydrogenedens sp.]
MSENAAPVEPRTPHWGPRMYWGLTAVCWAGMLWWSYIGLSQETVEQYYSRGLYRVFNGILPPITSLVPFSIALIIVCCILLGFPTLWIGRWIWLRVSKRGSHWDGLRWGLKGLLLLCPLIVCWFLLLWGAGYGRVPAEKRLALPNEEITDAESAEFRTALLKIVNDNAIPVEERDADAAVAAIAVEMREVIKAWDGRDVWVPRGVKRTPPGLLLANGTAGMAVPLTLEPHVDGGLPDTTFVYVAAHELGHVAGMNAEDEATLAGFAAGMKAKNAYAQYAVALDMYLDLARQLPSEDYKAALALLPQIAKDDLEASRQARAKYHIDWFDRVSWRAYDSYLKAQGVKEGRKSYSKGISLFVFAWRKGLATVPGLPSPAETAEASAA